MTYASFSQAIRSAMPEAEFIDGPLPEPAPAGQTSVTFRARPVPSGIDLSIRIGDAPPYRVAFSDEEEAAAFIGQLYASAMSGAQTPDPRE